MRVQACSPPKVIIRPQKSAKLNTEDEILIKGQVYAVALKVNLEYSFVSEDGMYRIFFVLMLLVSVYGNLLQTRTEALLCRPRCAVTQSFLSKDCVTSQCCWTRKIKCSDLSL